MEAWKRLRLLLLPLPKRKMWKAQKASIHCWDKARYKPKISCLVLANSKRRQTVEASSSSDLSREASRRIQGGSQKASDESLKTITTSLCITKKNYFPSHSLPTPRRRIFLLFPSHRWSARNDVVKSFIGISTIYFNLMKTFFQQDDDGRFFAVSHGKIIARARQLRLTKAEKATKIENLLSSALFFCLPFHPLKWMMKN